MGGSLLLFTIIIINSPARPAPRGGEPLFKEGVRDPWGPNPEGVFFLFINNNYKLYLK